MLALAGCTNPLGSAVVLSSQHDRAVVAPAQAAPTPTNAALSGDSQAPYLPIVDWRTSSPEAQGVDSARLGKLVKMLDKSWRDYDSVLVIRHGYVILEVYRNQTNANTRSDVHQVTQSILSVLFGIAMDEQKVALDDKMLGYFPRTPITPTNLPRMQNITLENLLAHTTGMELRRWDVLTGPHEPTDDWARYALNIPLVGEPDQACDMSSMPSHILASALHRALGEDLLDYANARLFAPLGIHNVSWDIVPPYTRRGDSGLHLTPREMAKLGYLALSDGRWGDQQIVSADWMQRSTCQIIESQAIDPDADNVMCYDWFYASETNGMWATRHPRFMAWGSGGYSIIGIPSTDMVIVTTGHTPLDDIRMIVMADSFLVSSVISDTALPPNPEAYALLQEQIKQSK